MTIVSCTKKLFEHSGFEQIPVPEVGMNPLYSWHAHLFRGGRKNCMMIMNDLTRYHLVFYGMKKEHYKNFRQIFLEAIESNFKANGIKKSAIQKYLSNMGEIMFTKTHNRSIVGSINDQIKMTDFRLDKFIPTEELNLVGLNIKNNHSPILVLKDGFPDIALRNALQDF